jgi:hypothetical protein
MKYSLQKLIFRNFATSNINKFKTVSSKVDIKMGKTPSDYLAKETHGLDKVPPKPGEIYPLPVVNSKLIALTHGYDEAFDREPVSAYYSIKVKDTLYHVFNAARIVK